MKAEFVNYLQELGMTGVLIDRVGEVYEFFKQACPEPIESIFVTDFIKDDDAREYQNLWFFSESFAMESKRFVASDVFDMTPIRNRVIHWEVKKRNYEFAQNETTKLARLSIEWKSDTDIYGEINGSKENCVYLSNIIRKYIWANMKLK